MYRVVIELARQLSSAGKSFAETLLRFLFTKSVLISIFKELLLRDEKEIGKLIDKNRSVSRT